MRRLVLLLLLIFLSFPAVAQHLPGAEDRRYINAKRVWLSGEDDLAALRQFAALASSGNAAAQLTLGVIERQYHTYHRAYADTNHGEIRRILRKFNGRRYGTSWLDVNADRFPAASLLRFQKVRDYRAHAIALADAGLIKAAMDYANLYLNVEADWLGYLKILAHPALLPFTKANIHRMARMNEDSLGWQNKPESATPFRELRESLPRMEFADSILTTRMTEIVRSTDIRPENDNVRMRGAALLLHPDLAPLARLIHRVCPEDTAYHMGALYHVTGGTPMLLMQLSPFVPMITTGEWQASPRFEGDVLLALTGFSEPDTPRAQASPCLYRAVREARD